MHNTISKRMSVRALTAAVGAVAVAGLTTPAMGVGEGTLFICNSSSAIAPVCPWYNGDGPIIEFVLPADQRQITGRNAVIGVVSALLPTVRFEGEPASQFDHVAFRDDQGRSRVLVGIVAGAFPDGRSADGDPSPAELVLQRQANGVLATALGNGDALLDNPGPSTNPPELPSDSTQGMAPEARAIVASVANGISGQEDAPQFETELNGMARSMLIMAVPSVADDFAAAYPDTDGDGQPDVVTADVIVLDIAEGGDLSGEGFLPRVADGIVHTYDVAVIAPTGDDADAPVPQELRQQFIFNQTLYAPASGYNVIGVGGQDLPAGAMNDNNSCVREYRASWYQSGRGLLRARNYAQFDPNEPTGFQEIPGARTGVSIVAPAAKLRIPDTTGPAAYARDENICLVLPMVGGGPGDEPPPDLAQSTRYAAGYAAGAVALMQDAWKRLRAEAPSIFRFERVPAVAVHALLINSAAKQTAFVSCWTNQSNFYEGNEPAGAPGFGTCQPFEADTTQQSLDSSTGGGMLNVAALHENFQGRPADDANGVLLQLPTMDVSSTSFVRPIVRNPPSPLGGAGSGGGPAGGIGDVDPPLGGPSQPPNIGNPGTIPPNWPIRIVRPRSNRNFENPQTLFTNSAFPVESIGWDAGRLGVGYIDYVIRSIIAAGDTFTVTLVFNRTQEIAWPNVAGGELLPLDIRDVETNLELEDINLLLFTSDSSGNPQAQIGRSATEWDNRELIYFDASVEQGPGGMPVTGRYLMRVEWEERKYDRFLRLFAADTQFGLAWRQQPVEQLGGGGPAFMVQQGDVNLDGVVNMTDVNLVISNFGQMNFAADANSDGIVNFVDLQMVLANFGREGQQFAAAN